MMLNNTMVSNEVLFKLTKEDVQAEAEHFYGQRLNE